ncbi:MAG: TIGR04282 family arsenosugar biosynthesis glycosyltransferase, partial [Candidatus Binatia bacterium]
RLYRLFLSEMDRRLADDGRWRFFWAFAPRESAFREEIAGARPAFTQSGGDLGRRMARAMGEAFRRGAASVVLVGSDLPHLAPARVAEAFGRLEAGADLVLGPARDGGYYLIGARRVPPVFSGIPWGGPLALGRTLAVARRRRLAVDLLPESYDLDRVDDLEELLHDPVSREIPATRRAVAAAVRGRASSSRASAGSRRSVRSHGRAPGER